MNAKSVIERAILEALSSVEVDSFDAQPDGGVAGATVDNATPLQIVSCFSDEFGPFSQVKEIESDFGRSFTVVGPSGAYLITANEVKDGGELVSNEVEIFHQ